MNFSKLRKLSERGQTMVEYILLIAVVIVILKSVFVKLNEYLITNPNSLQNKYLKSYENIFSAGQGGFTGRYKRFRIIK